MARKSNDRAEVVRCVRLAREIVDEAIPYDFESADVSSSSLRDDRAGLRKVALGVVLKELLDYETAG